ncbi:MAG: ABC transporter permease [Verrucomicrobiota bacterium]
MNDTAAETQTVNSAAADDEEWDLIIRPKIGWFDFRLRELWRYRDLIFLFVKRDFVSVYKQTILGPLWFLLQPLMTTLIFTIIFGRVAKLPTDGVPPMLFYMSGVTAWSYFAACLNKTSSTFVGNAGIFGKVYFPRLAIPVSVVISNLIAFGIQFLLFLGFVLWFVLDQDAKIQPNGWLLATPLLIIQMAILGLGFGIIVSSLTTKYRDLTQLVGFGVQLWMYLTPIVYPISQLSGKWQTLMAFNPMSAVVESFRFAFLGAGGVQLSHLAISWTMTVIVFGIGLMLFTRVEKDFMDTV